MESKTYSLPEVAQLLGMPKRTLYRHAAAGDPQLRELGAVRLGHTTVFAKAKVDKVLGL